MAKVFASFESIDGAEIAAMRLKDSLKTLAGIKTQSEQEYYMNQASSETRFADYFNYRMPFNNDTPYSSPWHSEYGYFEPQQDSGTRLTATVGATEVKKCQSIMLSLGGTKIGIETD